MFEDESSNDLQEGEVSCNECGMIEGHSSDCSHMALGEADSESNFGDSECPECGNRKDLIVEPNGYVYCDECESSWNSRTERPESSLKTIMTSRSEDGEYHEDLDFGGSVYDELNTEACPGCGSLPGDGIMAGCNDPAGCGYWKKFANKPDDYDYEDPDGEACPGCGARPGDGINANCNDPMGCGYFKEIGGQANFDSKQYNPFTKRQNWNEASDYDGLALNESSMFNRFDTLVGSRRDDTFDHRMNENMKLRALVKKVVSEIKEMKLSVSGPAFGSTPSDSDQHEDDLKDTKVALSRFTVKRVNKDGSVSRAVPTRQERSMNTFKTADAAEQRVAALVKLNPGQTFKVVKE